MEVNRPGQNKPNANQGADFNVGSQTQTNNQQSTPAGTVSLTARMRNVGNLGHGRNSSQRLQEALSAANELATERHKQYGSDYRMKVLPMAGDELGLAVSGLVFHETLEIGAGNQGLMTPFFVLLLEGTHDQTLRERHKINGESYDRKATISDFMQDATKDTAQELVARHVKNPGKLIYAGAFFVPKDVQLDVEHRANMDPFMGPARNAIMSRLQMALGGSLPGEEKITVAGFDVSTQKALVSVEHNQPKVDAIGRPVRADLTLRLSLHERNEQKTNSINVSQTSQKVCEVAGFVEPLFAPSHNAQMGMMGGQQGGPSFYYRPRFVMTHSESHLGINSMEVKLLEITMLSALKKNMTWARTWEGKNRRTVNGIDMRDPGALPMMMNDPTTGQPLGRVTDTAADSCDPQVLMTFLSAVMSPDLILAMDVEQCGPEYWLDAVFDMAAKEVDMNGPAHQMIIRHADILFNGNFSAVVKNTPNFRIAVTDGTRYSAGYYVEPSTGTRRDLAEIDTMAILNFIGDKDIVKARSFAQTQLQGQVDDHLRLVRRREIIEDLAPGAEFTGIKHRLMFTPMFMTALVSAATACGMKFDMEEEDSFGFGFAQNTGYLDSLGMNMDMNAIYNTSFNGGTGMAGPALGITGYY